MTPPGGARRVPRVDLHTHSTASDGTDAPAEVARLAAAAGLAAFALTDHDTLAGVEEAREEAARLGVEVVAGFELTAHVPFGSMHVLGYFVEEAHPAVRRTLSGLRAGRRARIERTVERLAALGVEVTIEEVLAQAGEGAPGRPHVARALVLGGHCGTLQEAFDRWLAAGRPAYVPRRELSPGQCVNLVHRAGGAAVLAHPFTLPREQVAAHVADLARWGLAGVEVHHPKHDEALRADLAALAKEHGLVATGGSDYHGLAKPGVAIGAATVEAVVLDELRARALG